MTAGPGPYPGPRSRSSSRATSGRPVRRVVTRPPGSLCRCRRSRCAGRTPMCREMPTMIRLIRKRNTASGEADAEHRARVQQQLPLGHAGGEVVDGVLEDHGDTSWIAVVETTHPRRPGMRVDGEARRAGAGEAGNHCASIRCDGGSSGTRNAGDQFRELAGSRARCPACLEPVRSR